MQRLGSELDVLEIVQRMLALYPQGKDRPDSVAEDWVRVLRDEPIASVWAAYEAQIRSTGQWAPSLGDFRARVLRHAHAVSCIMLSLQK